MPPETPGRENEQEKKFEDLVKQLAAAIEVSSPDRMEITPLVSDDADFIRSSSIYTSLSKSEQTAFADFLLKHHGVKLFEGLTPDEYKRNIKSSLTLLEQKSGLHFDPNSVEITLESAEKIEDGLKKINEYYDQLNRSSIDVDVLFDTDTAISLAFQEFKMPKPGDRKRKKGEGRYDLGRIKLTDLGLTEDEVNNLNDTYEENKRKFGAWMKSFPKLNEAKRTIRNQLDLRSEKSGLTPSQVLIAMSILQAQREAPYSFPVEVAQDEAYQKIENAIKFFEENGMHAFLFGGEESELPPPTPAPAPEPAKSDAKPATEPPTPRTPAVDSVLPPPVPPKIPAPAPVLPAEAAPTLTPAAVPEKPVAAKLETTTPEEQFSKTIKAYNEATTRAKELFGSDDGAIVLRKLEMYPELATWQDLHDQLKLKDGKLDASFSAQNSAILEQLTELLEQTIDQGSAEKKYGQVLSFAEPPPPKKPGKDGKDGGEPPPSPERKKSPDGDPGADDPENPKLKAAQAALEVARDELTNSRDIYARMLAQERKLNGLLERFFSSKEKKQQIIDDLETARADYHEKTKNLVECYTGERTLLAQAVFAQKQANRTAIEQGRALAEKMTGWWKGHPMLAKVAIGGLIGVAGAGAATLGGVVGGALGTLAVGAGGVLQVAGFSRNTLAIGDFAKNKTLDILLKNNSLKKLNTLTADNVKVMGEHDLIDKLNTYYYFAEAGLSLTGEKAPPGYKVLKAEYDRRESALKQAGHAGIEAPTTPAQGQPATPTTPQQAPEPEPLKTDWVGLSMREKMEIIEKRGLRESHFINRSSLRAEEELRWRMQTTENKARLTGFVAGAGVAAGIALGARALGQSLGQMIRERYFLSSPVAAPAAVEGTSTLNSTGAATPERFDFTTTVNRGEGLTAPVMRQLAQLDQMGDDDEKLRALAKTVGYKGNIHNHQLFARQIAIHDNLLNINGRTEEWVQAGQHVKLNADTGSVELYNADSTKVAWDANQNHQEGFTKTKGWYNKLHSTTEAPDTAVQGTPVTSGATPETSTGAVPPETPIPAANETVVAGTGTDLPAAGAESPATPEVAETPKVTPPVKNTPQGNPVKPPEKITEAIQAGVRPAAEATNPSIETAFSSTTFEGHAQHIDISINEKILGEKPLDKIRVLGDIGFNKQGELITDALQLGYDGDKYETMRQLAKYLHFPGSQFDQVWRSQSPSAQNGLVLRLTDLFKLVVAQKNIEGNSNEALNKALNAKINKAYEILARRGLQFE